MPIAESASEIDSLMSSGTDKFLVKGAIQASNPVGFADIGQKYIYAKEERARRVLRTKSVKRGKRWYSRTYYTWSTQGWEEVHSDNVNTLGLSIPYDKVQICGEEEIVLSVQPDDDTKYTYYGIPDNQPGLLLVTTLDGEIVSADIYPNMDIQDIVDRYDFKTVVNLICYWFMWLVITITALCFAEVNDII